MRNRHIKIPLTLTIFTPIFFSIMIAILIVTLISIGNSRRNIINSSEKALSQEVNLLVKMFQRERELKLDKVITGLDVAHSIFYSKPFKILPDTISILVENQITKQKHIATLNRWVWGNRILYKNNAFVDSVRYILHGGTVTIFQKTDSGYIRISTNVRMKDNSRAIGTYIPDNSPVIKAIENRRTYVGRAYVVNQWYITAYEPVVYDGRIVGMLYFGDKEKDLKGLKKIFNSVKLGKSGFVFVVDENKNCVICPEKHKSDVEKDDLLAGINAKTGIIRYKSQGKKLLAAYKYYDDFKLYVIAIVNETEETKSEIQTIIHTSLLIAFLITVILSLFIYLITRKNISQFLIKIEQKEKKIKKTTRELKQSENRFKTLFENAGDDIFVTDGVGNIIEVNKAACNTLGYSRNELLKMNMGEIKTSKYASAVQKTYETIYEKGKLTFESEHITKTGEILQVEIKSRVLESGNQKDVLSIARNISERKKVERRVLNAVIQTEERERERFAKDMHDGLGPLLSAIKLYANELSDAGLEKDEKKEMVKYIDELIDEAISNTRTISNNLMPRIINDYGVAKAIQSFCDKINKTEKINIHFHPINIDNSLNQNVQLILYRAVSELINNTMKHAFAKNIYIDLNKEGNKISLIFCDDGKGFEVDNILENKCSGMGLRNVISRIRSINGNCKFFSSPGEGFKITIEIDL